MGTFSELSQGTYFLMRDDPDGVVEGLPMFRKTSLTSAVRIYPEVAGGTPEVVEFLNDTCVIKILSAPSARRLFTVRDCLPD